MWNDAGYGVLTNEVIDGGAIESVWRFIGPDGTPAPNAVTLVTPDDGQMSISDHGAWNGTEYAIVYEDERRGANNVNSLTFFARVSAGGVLVPNSEVALPPPSAGLVGASLAFPSVVWNPLDGEWAVMWEEQRLVPPAEMHLKFARLNRTGTLIAGSERTLPDAVTGVCHQPSLTWVGDGYAVVWTSMQGLVFTRITRAGALGLSHLVARPPAQALPFCGSIAFTGSEFGVTWAADVSSTGNQPASVLFARLDASGALIAGSTRLIDGPTSQQASVVWTGTSFAAVWAHGDSFAQIWLAHLDALGDLVPGSKRQVTCDGSNRWPTIQWNGTRLAISYDSKVNPNARDSRRLLLIP